MPSEDRKAFLLRIDAKLWAELEVWAGDELRSVNGQIEFLLRQVVQQRRHRRQVEDKTESSDPNT
jgi:hypothetical protein